MKTTRLLLAMPACLAAGSGILAAEPRPLSGDELTAAISGNTLLIETRIGMVPVLFKADGGMEGQSKEVARYVGVERDTGTWWVSKDRQRLCQKWRSWMEGKLHCFTLRQEGAVLHWARGDGETGLARIATAR